VLSPEIGRLLRCPVCRGELATVEATLTCTRCERIFPVVQGVPILLNESNSLFRIVDYTDPPRAHRPPTLAQSINKTIQDHLPSLGRSRRSGRNYAQLAALLMERPAPRRVLVVGAGILGEGIRSLITRGLEVIDMDVVRGPGTAIIADAHDLPWADGAFDAVVAQAVLEHVLDPPRCVAEMHRVLKVGGFVYAETPFLQQVHSGAYDFLRFSPLAHRRLFRFFEEVASGSSGGPAIVLAWSWKYFLLAFARTRWQRPLLNIAAHLTGFWLQYLDRAVIDTPAGQDGSWGYYFLGRRSDTPLDDRALLSSYPGAGVKNV
jgi:SAM-dependent methyltransferase